MLETIATKAVEQNEAVLTDLAKKIWDCPETAFNEVKACEWTAQVLRDAGFQVEVGCANLPHSHSGHLGKRSSGHRIFGRV